MTDSRPAATDDRPAATTDDPIERAAWYLSRAQVRSRVDVTNMAYHLEAYKAAGGQWTSSDNLMEYLSGLGEAQQVNAFIRSWRALCDASAALGGPVLPSVPSRPRGRPQRGAVPPWPVWRPTDALVTALRVVSTALPLRIVATRRWRHVWSTYRLRRADVHGVRDGIQRVDTRGAALHIFHLEDAVMAALNVLAREAGGTLNSATPAGVKYPHIERMLAIQPNAALVAPALWGTIPASAARLREILGVAPEPEPEPESGSADPPASENADPG